jgi:hypothetical protein
VESHGDVSGLRTARSGVVCQIVIGYAARSQTVSREGSSHEFLDHVQGLTSRPHGSARNAVSLQEHERALD